MQFNLSGRDLTAQLYRQLLDAVLDGRLRPGEQLPPTRELARQVEVSRNTVAAAYDRLTAEGFLEGRVGAGTFVTGDVSRQRPRSAPAGRAVRPRQVWRDHDATPAQPAPEFDFSVGVPDPNLFPLAT